MVEPVLQRLDDDGRRRCEAGELVKLSMPTPFAVLPDDRPVTEQSADPTVKMPNAARYTR
jgi:hypothetical protein